MGLYLLDREPPLDPPEPEVAFYCADCGGEIYIGETYFRVDGKNYCEGCVSTEIAEPEYDEALIQTAVDISGRSHLSYGLEIPTEKIGSFDSELVEEFWLAFVRQCPMSLHIRQLAGKNSHHIVEGCFKSVARSLRFALASDGTNDIPSTKGVL